MLFYISCFFFLPSFCLLAVLLFNYFTTVAFRRSIWVGVLQGTVTILYLLLQSLLVIFFVDFFWEKFVSIESRLIVGWTIFVLVFLPLKVYFHNRQKSSFCYWRNFYSEWGSFPLMRKSLKDLLILQWVIPIYLTFAFLAFLRIFLVTGKERIIFLTTGRKDPFLENKVINIFGYYLRAIECISKITKTQR